MKKLKSILIHDEPKNLELLSYYLEKYSTDTEIVGSFSEKRAALEYLDNEDNLSELDIIFLDMILDEGTGFDILDNIDYSDIHIVICTAHDEFALKAIQYEVVDYLMKPIEIQDLQNTLIKSEKKTGKMKSHSMTLVPFQNFPMPI